MVATAHISSREQCTTDKTIEELAVITKKNYARKITLKVNNDH